MGEYDKLREERHNLIELKSENERNKQELIREITNLRNEVNSLKGQNKKLEDVLQANNLQLKFGGEKEDILKDQINSLKQTIETKNVILF